MGFSSWWGKVQTHFKATLVSVQRLSWQEDDKSHIKQGKDITWQWVLAMRKLLVLVVNELAKVGLVGKSDYN